MLVATLPVAWSGPDYVRPAAPVPAAYKEGRGLEGRTAQRRRAARQLVGSLQRSDLNALVAQVDISNQTVQAAEARVREASAATQAARAALFPVVGGSGAAVRSGRGTGVEFEFECEVRCEQQL